MNFQWKAYDKFHLGRHQFLPEEYLQDLLDQYGFVRVVTDYKSGHRTIRDFASMDAAKENAEQSYLAIWIAL